MTTKTLKATAEKIYGRGGLHAKCPYCGHLNKVSKEGNCACHGHEHGTACQTIFYVKIPRDLRHKA